MAGVGDEPVSEEVEAVHAVWCVDAASLDRFHAVLRHLVVGLVDQAVSLRLLSDDPRIESLSLGPVQALHVSRMTGPFVNRRSRHVVDTLSGRPPTVVHAIGRDAFPLACVVSNAFGAGLVSQIASLEDCQALARPDRQHIGHFVALSRPLAGVLADQLGIAASRISLVVPGLSAARQVACFNDPDHTPAVVCPTSLDRGCGVERLIEAVEILRSREHELMVFVLGRGGRELGFRRLIRERKLGRHMTLVDPTGDLSQTMRSADILVQPSTEAAVHAAELQAMALGLAVVAVQTSLCDHLIPEQTAVIAESPGARPLADAIERLLTNRDTARRIAAAGMEHVRNHHTVSRMARSTAEVYRKLARQRTAPSVSE